jgi:hypothetical protein
LSSYSKERTAFGKVLSEQPLFASTIFNEELVYLAGFMLTFKMSELLGKEELKAASEAEMDLLRLFTPITKLFTAKAAVKIASEVVEGFGGAGYIEDTMIPTLYRDNQVFSIWEGATNILSLDVLRVLEKTSAFKTFIQEAGRILKIVEEKDLSAAKQLREHVDHLQSLVASANPQRLLENARGLAFYFAHIYSSLLIAEWAAQDPSQRTRLNVGLKYWMKQFAKFEFEPDSKQNEIRQFFDGT